MKRLFKLLAASSLSCLSLVTLHAQTCDEFKTDFNSNLGSGVVGEIGWGQVCPNLFGNSVHYTVVSLPEGYTVDNYQDGDECITIHGAAQQSGLLHFIIAAQTTGGCEYTIDFAKNFQCPAPDSIKPTNTMLPYAVNGKFYTQDFTLPLPYTVESIRYEMEGSVPGLTLQSGSNETSAFLSGVPTTVGTYKFRLRAIVGDNCIAGDQVYTLIVGNTESVKSLIIYQQCNRNNFVRNWQIHNPNNFAVPVKWELLFYSENAVTRVDAFTAEPGDTYFETPSTANPNTIQISWYDGVSSVQTIEKSSFVGLCNPPTCVYASNVVKYTLGLKKSGENLSVDENLATATLGIPDANDAPTAVGKYLTLGYTGFVVLQLSSVLIDQPGNDLIIYEYSAGNPSFGAYPERAEVFVSKDGEEWISLGLTNPATCQSKLDHSFDLSGKIDWCRYVRVLDKTDRHAKVLDPVTCEVTSAWAFDGESDGFDLDAITCSQDTGIPVLGTEGDRTSNTYILYPNPAHHVLTVDLSKDQSITIPNDGRVEINISDISGNGVYRTIQTHTDGVVTLEVSDLRAGMYILNVRTGIYSSGFYKFMKH
jgi:hypothetical protein